MFQKTIAAVLLAALLLPSAALASRPSGFPRFFERDGEVCVQTLNSDNTVNEQCRPAEREAQQVQLQPVPLGTTRPFRGGWSSDPAATARRHAEAYGDDSRFGTGFALGLFLGLIGTVIGGVVAGNSSVEVPPPHPEYDGHQAYTYQRAFAEEVRSSRTSSAVVGGLLGTAVTVGVVLLLVSQSNNDGR